MDRYNKHGDDGNFFQHVIADVFKWKNRKRKRIDYYIIRYYEHSKHVVIFLFFLGNY